MMRLRRWLVGANAVVVVALLGVLFILVNFLASRRYLRTDLAKTRITALSDKTRQVLTQLNDPVRLVVFYQPTEQLYELIQDVLKEYERHGQRLAIEYVDPDQDIARARQLAKEFDVDRPNLVIVESAGRHKYLSDTDLAEYDYGELGLGGQPRLRAFKAEDALTSAIVSVTQATQPLVWVSTGHGEHRLDDADLLGLADLKKYLERENMKVQNVTLLERTEIPSDVHAIFFPGPTHRMTEQELLLLQAYLERGGRVLALIDPLENSGLDDWLTRWGIELGQDIVVDPARQLPFISAANVFVTTYTQHPIVEHMETLMTLFPLARSVQPAKEAHAMTVTPLAMTSEQGWGETDTASTKFQFNREADRQGPVSIAVAAERTGSPTTRLVVIGDSDFVTNGQLTNVGNLDFILSAFHWLVSQEQLIGIGPKPLETIKLTLTAEQMRGMFWLSLTGLPFAIGLLGALVWWLRRD